MPLTMTLRSLALLALIVLALPAQAADVVFPTGSHVGIAPPPGMQLSRSFFGFEDADNKVAIVLVALPAGAFGEVERSLSAEPLKEQGVVLETREALTLPAGAAVLAIGRQELNVLKLRKWIVVTSSPELTAIVTAQVPDDARSAYPDEVLRAALTSVAMRATVPVPEQLSLLPFKVHELAGFRVGGLLAGRAVMLTDAPVEPPTEARADPHMMVAIAPGGPAQAGDRAAFAREALGSVPNLKEVRIASSEPLRMGGQQGHQIMANGKDNATGVEVTIVQWLRFGAGGYMQMVAVAPTADWPPAYTRFRQVRDGVDLH